MARTPLVAGNWKLHGSRASNKALLDALLGGVAALAGAECAVCVPFPYLGEVGGQLRGSAVALGAQNASEHARGADKGGVLAGMVNEFRCRFIVPGQFERRPVYCPN